MELSINVPLEAVSVPQHVVTTSPSSVPTTLMSLAVLRHQVNIWLANSNADQCCMLRHAEYNCERNLTRVAFTVSKFLISPVYALLDDLQCCFSANSADRNRMHSHCYCIWAQAKSPRLFSVQCRSVHISLVSVFCVLCVGTVTCTSNQFACSSGIECIPQAKACDGIYWDCGDGSDESRCTTQGTPQPSKLAWQGLCK